MKLIDLKIPKMSKKDMEASVQPSTLGGGDLYPYGQRLTFESDQVEKMPGMEKYKVGEKVKIQGMGEVTSIRMNEDKDKKRRYTIEVQLHEVGCDTKDNYDDSFKEAAEGGQ